MILAIVFMPGFFSTPFENTPLELISPINCISIIFESIEIISPTILCSVSANTT